MSKIGMGKLKELAPFVKEALSQTVRLGKILCCFHIINNTICSVNLLVGSSMLPTFTEGNLVLSERIATRLGNVGSGDVVLVRSPENPRKIVCKRVKGVEGDIISYLPEPSESDEQKTVEVPKGHVWVEGDNIYASRDSRNFGPVPLGLLHGRIYYQVWPLKDFKAIGRTVI